MRVLISEDNVVSRRLLETFLRKWGYDVLATDDGTGALEELRKPEAPNLVISDWIMPGMDGLDLCRKIRESKRPDYVYFILLTAKGNKKDVVKGLEAGADDYLVKPFDQQELRCRVRIGERILDLERRIKHLASTDSLTGVLNRRAFMERMAIELHRSVREKTVLSLLLADIDHFKKINDRFGHQSGDVVLQEFAKQLSVHSRPYDFVGRYGGEEFVLCFPGANRTEAITVARRTRRRVKEMRIALPNGKQTVQITASFGVSSFGLDGNDSLDALIARSDEAMYQAKREGRNRVCAAKEYLNDAEAILMNA